MSIVFLKSPSRAFGRLQRDLEAWMAGGLAQGLTGAPSLDASHGIPVYEIAVADAIADRPLLGARQVRSRHLLFGSDVSCFADLSATEAEGERLLEVVCGEAAEDLVRALRSAELLADDGEYQLRILEVPSCDLAALWLSGRSDKFIPLMQIAEARTDTSTTFLERVKNVAVARRETASIWGELDGG
jgi:hypothetical protein